MGFLPLLFGLLSGLPGILGDYFKKKQELEQIKLETERQIALAQQQMASDIAKAESEIAVSRLGATGSYFKYFTFAIWFGPFISGVFVPRFAEGIFNNLAKMPVWYVQSCVMIMFAIWGIQVAAPVVANIFTNLGAYLSDKRDYKLEKARINRDAVFASLRNDPSFKGRGIDQATVVMVDKALDAGEAIPGEANNG